MKKLKFFVSLSKERDWLEEMARKGWLLTNITLGILYTFKEIEPCEKVYEVERFAVSSKPTIEEITSRKNALDIASQCGWELVTHDESMNYYFVKDKAGDETDEFYNDEETRRERAERYRKTYAIEMPLSLLYGEVILSILYAVLYFLMGPEDSTIILAIYLFVTLFELICICSTMAMGQQIYREFCMSREEWSNLQKYKEKARFKKVSELRSYLQEKNKAGLAVKDYEKGKFVFEEDDKNYDYFVDTKACLKKRLKNEGTPLKSDIGLRWYEASVSDAAKYGLKPVAVINQTILLYRRPGSDKANPWENDSEKVDFSNQVVMLIKIVIATFGICFAIGFIAGFISNFIF